MIHAVVRGATRTVVLLGLTHETVARLFANEPVVVATSKPPPDGLGLDGAPDIILIAGSDETAIYAALSDGGLVSNDTVIHDTRPGTQP